MSILTLALGIGGNTAIFGSIDGVLLSPLPYPDRCALTGPDQRARPRSSARRLITADRSWSSFSKSRPYAENRSYRNPQGPAGDSTTLYVLMGAVAVVLSIACTKVADLMLARAPLDRAKWPSCPRAYLTTTH